MTSKYRKGKRLGEGTWGEVYEAYTLTAGSQPVNTRVAIKRIKAIPADSHLPPGVNFTAIREIKHMRELKGSPYIVNVSLQSSRVLYFTTTTITTPPPPLLQLIDVFVSEEEHVLHLVMEFCTFDLEKVIRDKSILLRPPQIKKYAIMLLEGIHWCHSHFVLHRGK